NPDAYVAWALALASIGAHLAVDYLLRGDASFLFGFNVDVETFALVGLSVLLVFVRPLLLLFFFLPPPVHSPHFVPCRPGMRLTYSSAFCVRAC
ncbi:hypothetical protein GR268_47880, partial [Rhizobium leguminosarum]|nr:hypothetical protein [Rhizobium leguminosarum]